MFQAGDDAPPGSEDIRVPISPLNPYTENRGVISHGSHRLRNAWRSVPIERAARARQNGAKMTVIGMLLAALLAADPAPPAEPPDEVRVEVEKLIQQLDAPALAERRRAEQELLDLGPKILRWLPPKELVKSAATWEAVQRIGFHLQRRFAQESARPSRVTLKGAYRLADLLTELSRQTGNPLQLPDDLPDSAASERTWNLERATFWEAIDEICRTTTLATSSRPESQGLGFLATTPGSEQLAVSHAGVLRAELQNAARQPVTGDPQRSLIRLRGELAFEPRLRPLFVHFKAGDFAAADAGGHPVKNWNPDARYELPMAGASRRTQLTWDFVAPSDAVPKSLSLKGKLLVQLAAATEPIRFDRIETDREVLRRRGGVSVRMHQSEFVESGEGRDAARVKISVSYDVGGPAFESHRTWVYHNAAWLEDGERRIPFTDFDTLLQTDGSVQLEYRFQNLPPRTPLKFVYEAPTLLLDVPFEIDFRHVAITDSPMR